MENDTIIESIMQENTKLLESVAKKEKAEHLVENNQVLIEKDVEKEKNIEPEMTHDVRPTENQSVIFTLVTDTNVDQMEVKVDEIEVKDENVENKFQIDAVKFNEAEEN